jgi:TATA-box binding protein (TBP) (component of TFIID and TFIIIB)
MTDAPTVTIPTLEFTPLRVSTIVTTAQIGCEIALEPLYHQIRVLEYWDLTDGVLKAEYKDSKHVVHIKGTTFKDIMLKEKEKKTFFNQLTLVVRREVADTQWKEINVKLFQNGGVQITGVRSEEMSSDVLRWLFTHIQATCTGIFAAPIRIHEEAIKLVNTDFSIGAKVHREDLFRILCKRYRLRATYEAAFYQGVNTKYFYNEQKPAGSAPGLCTCSTMCKGKGEGAKIGECKMITISPFQTGNVIITGARNMKQIEEAYEFIKNVFTLHKDEILRKTYNLPGEEEPVVKAPRASNGWIQHPCPRNVFKVPASVIVEE